MDRLNFLNTAKYQTSDVLIVADINIPFKIPVLFPEPALHLPQLVDSQIST